MKRTVAVAAGWAAATAAAVTVAWGGVSLVADQVVDPLPTGALATASDSSPSDDVTPSEDATPSDDRTPSELPTDGATDDDGGLRGDGSPDDDGPTTAPTPAPANPAPAPTTGSTPAPAPTSDDGPSDDDTPEDGPTDDDTPSPSPSSSPSPSASPSPSSSPASQPEVRTYALVGGNVTLRYVAPGRVEIVSAQPNQGFTMDTSGNGTDHVDVRFESEAHESRLDGWWEAGHAIRDRVEERPED